MKNAVAIAVSIVVVAGAVCAYTIARDRNNRAREIEARKAEDVRKTAEAERKKADAEARKAKDDAAAEQSKAETAKAEQQTKLAAEAEAKQLAIVREEEAKIAEANAKAAEEAARKAEAERKTAEANRDEAASRTAYAEATNALRQAELQTALAAAHLVELDLEKLIATSNVLALQKADYASKIAEVEALQEELRRREEETRPNKTLLQLMAENEAAMEAERIAAEKAEAQYAEEDAARRRILREGVPAAPKKPLSIADKRLAAAREALDSSDEKGGAETSRRITESLEALMRQAVSDGRTDAAEAYLAALKALVPDYGKAK